MRDPRVQDICDQIKLLDGNDPDELARLKRQLPIITPHACRFTGDGSRKSANAVPSGLVMLDIDHIDNPRDVFSTHIFPVLNNNNLNNLNQQQLRSQQHSERSEEHNSQPLGCGLISPDGSNDRSAYVPQRNVVENNVVDVVVNSTPVFNPSPVVNPTPVGNPSPVGCRSAAEIERELTSLILKAQQDHEEIILEVTDFRPGTEHGYNTPCEPELQQHAIDARRAAQRYNELCPTECHA